MFSANLLMGNRLTELKYINALKLSLSHIFDKGELILAISKKRTLMLESNEDNGLDILDILSKHVIVDSAISPNTDESELTSYRKFIKIFDDIFDGTNLDLVDGEIPCQTTKAIAKNQENLFGNKILLNKGFGRRIDLILSTKGSEFSSSEWKKNQEDVANVFVVGMDWTGSLLYKWREHHLKLKNILLPAIRKVEHDTFFDAVLGQATTMGLKSPNIYRTSTRPHLKKDITYDSNDDNEEEEEDY
ncbi:hypothetical protein INT48_006880 [Thamnidium elegans]|uniref:Uncharacterized protein n=1 Tax=Thamnidium elegans TaxID=101142 RepID=A0A8H7SIU5_9FUNG|nr:hypothetical protein INT48_006880 [Thamnidium elegans]